MNITIFGGGGFIGSAIVDRLLLDSHSITIFERPRVAPSRIYTPDEKVNWITGDLLSTYDVSNAIEGSDVVFHLVSTTLPKSSNDDPIYDVQSNIVAALQMLNLMVQKSVRRIVFISSGGTVYGAPEYIPIDEKHPTNPLVSYGVTKLTIEKYLLIYARLYGIQPVILRVSNPYGERQRLETAQGAVGVFISRALQGRPIEIWGDGSVVRDFLYVGDVAEAFARAVFYEGHESIFNISSARGLSLNELIKDIEEVLDVSIERQFKPARSFDIPANILSNQLARKELSWVPKIGMKEGVALTARWMREEAGFL